MPADRPRLDGCKQPSIPHTPCPRLCRTLGVALLACLLAACGGSDPPPADAPPVASTPLKWDAGAWDNARWQ